MGVLGIIGGSGLGQLDQLHVAKKESVATEFGLPSSDLVFGQYHGCDVAFLTRHGEGHSIPPHRINYRANIRALKKVGVTEILAVAAVGGIRADLPPATIAIPDQLIDYTVGRESTFYNGDRNGVVHIDFSYPYSQAIRAKLLSAAARASVVVVDGGVYGCTQGPRLETAAEIRRMEGDGCDMVGMTGMPEAALAREDEIDYACCAVMAN